MSSSTLAITFVGVLQVAGLAAAFQLGRQQERDEKKWPKGSMLDGGWKAWRVPLIILVAVAAAITVFLPVMGGRGGLLGGLFSGGRGGYARGGYSGGGYSGGGYAGGGYARGGYAYQ